MVHMSSIAHPYANAVFKIAKSANTIDPWLKVLSELSQISVTKEYKGLITNPRFDGQKIVEILLNLIKSDSTQVQKFLKLLADNKRLSLLSDIFVLFNDLVAEERNTAKAIIQSAFPMSDDEKQQFEKLLSNKFGKTISADVEVSATLIGGVKILINDTVIDASVKGSLDKMATQIIQ
jgi:F-type H+-transporting ATPase subunit delta